MKIAMLGHKRMPSREGGVEIVVEELSTRLVALGHEVTVYSRRGHNVAGASYDAQELTEYQGVRIKTVPTIEARGLAALSSSFFATIAALRDKPDVIHFHAEGPCAMIPLAKLAGVRSVATIHGLDWQRAKWGRFATSYLKHGERVAATKADELIVLSKNTQDYFRETYGRETNYIPNGVTVNDPVPAEAITSAYGLAAESYVLFCGRIVPEKGIHYLIEAWQGLETDKTLVIAGGSSDSRDYFERVKELAGDNPQIVFTDFVQGRVLQELFSNACLYVLPSDLEGMPISLLEAMSYGRCCLTSDIPECAEVLGETGVTFRRSSVEALRDALQGLLANDRLRHEYGAKARARVVNDFGWDSVVERTLELYRQN